MAPVYHDRLFKEPLTTFFLDFHALFLPEIRAALDTDFTIVPICKENFTDVTRGEKHEADVLMKAKFQAGNSMTKLFYRVLFYCTRINSIGGQAEVTGPYFEDHAPIWESSKPGEVYPVRFPTKMIKARLKDNYLPRETLVHSLESPKRWPAANWTLAFQGNVRVFNDDDFHKMAEAL